METKTDDNELTLVHEARNGDRDAIQRLLLLNWHWTKGLVLGILHRWEDVDDVLQAFTDDKGKHWLVEGLRENKVKPAVYYGDF